MPGMPAAKLGDKIIAVDLHLIQPPGPVSPVLVPHPYTGIITGGCCPTVLIGGVPAATIDSTAVCVPPHVPVGGTFVNPPTNRATMISGSTVVKIHGKPALRAGDPVMT